MTLQRKELTCQLIRGLEDRKLVREFYNLIEWFLGIIRASPPQNNDNSRMLDYNVVKKWMKQSKEFTHQQITVVFPRVPFFYENFQRESWKTYIQIFNSEKQLQKRLQNSVLLHIGDVCLLIPYNKCISCVTHRLKGSKRKLDIL